MLRRIPALEQGSSSHSAPTTSASDLDERVATLELRTQQTADRSKQLRIVASANLASLRAFGDRLDARATQANAIQHLSTEIEQLAQNGRRIMEMIEARQAHSSGLVFVEGSPHSNTRSFDTSDASGSEANRRAHQAQTRASKQQHRAADSTKLLR